MTETDAGKRLRAEVAKEREVAEAGMRAYVGALLQSQHDGKTVFEEFHRTFGVFALASAGMLAGDVAPAQREVRTLACVLDAAAAGMVANRRLVRLVNRPRR